MSAPAADGVRSTSRSFPAEPTSSRAARRFVDDALRAWSLDDHAGDVALVVSELVTNALLHVRSSIRVTVLASRPEAERAVRIEVHDESTSLPVPGAIGDASMTGRGLGIITELADRWGVEAAAPGKVVWAEFGADAAFFRDADAVALDPAASAVDPLRDDELPDGLRRVVLRGLPARLTLASNSHLDDVVRELRLMDRQAAGVLPLDVADAARQLLAQFSTHTGSAEARDALDRGEASFDLEIAMPPEASVHLMRLTELLDDLNDEMRRGNLLTSPAPSEVTAFRRWCAHEISRQLAGRLPSPCPFDASPSSWQDASALEEIRLREARYRSLIEAGELDVWRADHHGNLITDMPEWRSVTGQSSGDVLGEGWLEGVHPDHRRRVGDTWRRAVEAGAVYHCEYPIVGPDGQARHVIARAAPVREGGLVREWVGTTVDVTDQRVAEDDVAAQTRLVETLHEIGIKLATTLDLEVLLPTLVRATTELTGAQFGAFFFNRVDEAGEDYQLVTLHGATMDDFSFGMPRNTKVFAPTFAGTGPSRHDDVTKADVYGHNPPYNGMPQGHLPVRSYLAVPVLSRTGDVHGGLFFGHEDVGVFDERHERAVVGIAAQASVAIDNALLLEAERGARAAAERANRRQAVLAEAMERLSASLDVDDVVTTLADLVVPDPAAWSAVEMTTGIGRTEVVATAGERSAGAASAGAPVHRIDLRTKQVAAASLVVQRHDAQPFTAAEVALLEDIALRGGVAVDNALLFTQQRDAALTLQRTLLPRERPVLQNLDYAIRYLPAAAGSQVGGDFFDIVQLDPRTVAIAVGDVQGKGVQAAAYMGQIRAATRAYTMAGLGPGAVLQFVDRMWEQQADVLATCIQAQLDQQAGGGRVASAGHLPPLRFGNGREPQYVELRPGAPLGTAAGVYLESSFTLARGEGLVLFTDGLVEHRGRSIDDGLDALRAVVAVAAASGDEPDRLADRIVDDLLSSGHDDDVALLVVQRKP
ncbi:MAG TPA: SpoIIE family protein phosphatase [Acidimicrobiales bacterium]|nr:SpoIIE family protein phosphatase [Acidimicrobiales bacterium]